MEYRDLQRESVTWAGKAFGWDHVNNRQLRALRMIEEAVEVAQALHLPKEKVLLAVEHVYKRRPGQIAQELGGLMVTIAVLAQAIVVDPMAAFEAEVRRVLSMPLEHFAKRNREKNALGLNVDEGSGLA